VGTALPAPRCSHPVHTPQLSTAGTPPQRAVSAGFGSFTVDELRLELDRLRVHVAGLRLTADADDAPGLCTVPLMVPPAAGSVVVTPAMRELALAVARQGSQEVGMLGLGGVGKTTVAAWIARQAETRRRFDRIAWLTFGQTPNADKCVHARTTVFPRVLCGARLTLPHIGPQVRGRPVPAAYRPRAGGVVDDGREGRHA
jgi:hypothetical protein